MKGLFLISIFSFSLISISLGDIVAPNGATVYLTSDQVDGNVTVNAGGVLNIQLSSGAVMTAGMSNDGVIADNSDSDITLAAQISGTGAYYKGGLGTTLLTGSISSSGVTYVNNGTLQAGGDNVFSSRSAIHLSSTATLDLNNFRQMVGSLSGSGGVYLGSNPLAGASGLVFSGGSLTTGSGTGLTVSGGVLNVGASLSSGATVNLSIGAGLLMPHYSSGTGVLTLTVTQNTDVGQTTGTTGIISTGTLVIGSGAILNSNPPVTSGSIGIIGGSLSGSIGNIGGISGGNLILSSGSGSLNLSGSSYGSLTNHTGTTVDMGGISINPEEMVTYVANGTELTVTGSNGLLGTAAISGANFEVSWGETIMRMMMSSMMMTPMSLISSITGSGNGVLITGNDHLNTIYSGTISGNGQVIKSGSGVWNFAGSNTSTGLMTVAQGGMLVNGSVAGDVYVAGGFLGGSGTIGGSVLNESVVSPGNSPGTLTISGNYSQSAAGLLVIQVASSSVYDQLIISGTALLNGTLMVQPYNGYVPSLTDTYQFLMAAGGISGQFAQVLSPTLIGYTISMQSGTLTLTPVQSSFAETIPNLTPNERAIGRALDQVATQSSLSNLVNYLDGLPLSEIPGAYDQIAPTALLPMFEAGIVSANIQSENLERRLEEVRGGSTGWSLAGLRLSNRTEPDTRQPVDKEGKTIAPAPISDRWGFFINGSGEFVDVESTGNARGTDFTTAGLSAGADYRLSNSAAFGVTAGYANTQANGRADHSVKTNTGSLGVYGTVFTDGFFVNGAVGGGLENFDTKRGTLGGTARGDSEGNLFHALLGTGYTYRCGGWSAGPVASLRYNSAAIDGFTEHGSLAPLRLDDQSEASLKSTVGMQTAYAFQLCSVTVRPELRAQWQHEHLESTRSLGASFLPGGSFTVWGPEIGRDSLLLDAGVTVQFTSQMGVYAFYTGDLGRQNYSAQSVNGGVTIRF